MAPQPVNRDFTADADGLAELDDWIERATADWPSGEPVLKARVCAAELAANLMEHGSGPAGPARLSVRLAAEGPDVRLELTDNGRPFDPTEWHASAVRETLQTATIGGRGLRTVHGLSRELHYSRREGRNHLSLLVAGG